MIIVESVKQLPLGLLRGAISCYFKISLFHILRDVFQTTIQRGTQLAQRFGFDVVIGFQPSDGFAVDAALLA